MTRSRHLRRVVAAPLLAPLLGLALVACGGDGDEPAAGGPELTGEAARGEELVRSEGCVSCHTVDGGSGIGPTLQGVAGSEVELTDGTTVTADDAYLRRSIEEPGAQIVKGYRGIMPERNLSPGDVDAIVAYLNAIGAGGSGAGS